MWSARSRTGWTVIWASGLAAPVPDLLGGDRAGGLLDPSEPAGAEDGGLFEVDVQHHLTLARARCGSAGRLGEVEGGWLRARLPAAMERRTSRDSVEPSRSCGWASSADGGVEVDRVGQVQLALDQHGAGGADLVQVHVQVPRSRGRGPVGFGPLGVEPGDRLLDQPVQLRGADLVRHVRDVGIHERRGLG